MQERLGTSYRPLPVEVTENIAADRLSVYEQAAKASGFKIRIIGRAGDACVFIGTSTEPGEPTEEELVTITLGPGRVAVSISRDPKEHRDHSSFWKAMDLLRDASKKGS